MLTGANAHGHLMQPASPETVANISGYGDHWYSQGSMIGCNVATGVNCNTKAPCCGVPMKPTLKTSDQLSYLSFEGGGNFDGFLDDLNLGDQPAVNVTRSLRGLVQNPDVTGAFGGINSSLAEKAVTAPFSTNPGRMNPWMAPGYAPVADPCGILGGWRFPSARDYIAGPGDAYEKYTTGKGGPTNTVMPPKGMTPAAGTTGSSMVVYAQDQLMQDAQGEPYETNTNPKWKAGSEVEVSYTIVANHGGGGQYRLCPLEKLTQVGGTDTGFTDECFAENVMPFVGDSSWFVYKSPTNSSFSGKIEFPAVRVRDANTDGVLPKGSTWTKIGIPACSGARGGAGSGADSQCDTPQFHNPITEAGFWGFGNEASGNSPALKEVLNNWFISDKVQVPEGLEGDYVLQWRWDSEQTAQVWTQCAVVTIEA